MDGAVVVAIASAVIAGLSLLVAARALVYSHRAEARAERADERSEIADQRAQRGQPSARYVGYVPLDPGGEEHPRGEFRFLVTNVGAGAARHVMVRLTDAAGRSVGDRSPGRSLSAGEVGEFAVWTGEPADTFAYPLEVRLGWLHWERDDRYEHVSRIRVPRP